MGNVAIQWGPTAALLAASGYILLLVLVVSRRGLSGATERWFASFLVFSVVWTVAWALSTQWGWIKPSMKDLAYSVSVYSSAFLAPILAILTLDFLPRRGVKEVAFLGLLWIISVTLLERGAVVTLGDRAALDFFRLVGWASFVVGSIALTAVEYLQLRRPLHRNRVLYWLVALILVAVGDALYYSGTEAPGQFGLLLRLLGAMMLAYSIVTYSLPDLKSAGRRTLLQISVTLVRALVFLAAIVGAVAAFRLFGQTTLNSGPFPWLIIIVGAITALIFAVVEAPVQKLVADLAERLLFGPRYDASRALRNYSQSVSNILQIERLARVAVETIADALDVDRGGLLHITAREDGGADVRVIPGLGEITAMNVAFAPNSPVLRALQGTQRPLTQYDIDMLPEFRVMDSEERQWQWALEVEVYVPIHANRTLIGALVLGAKRAGEPYHAQDLDILNTLAGQTAVALENARLFDDQKRLNEEVSQLNEELITVNMRLEKLDKAKTDFLNITSHELRTPLTQVRGYADVLGEMVQDSEFDQRKMLNISNRISRAADRLDSIYSAMFDVSAIGVDALQLRMEPVKPVQFVTQAVDRWMVALEQRQQSLVVFGIEELPYLDGDFARLVQAFSNLVNNAIKFTPDGGRIEIWGRLVQGPEPVIEIVVADSGVGIDLADHDMIFEKFYRAGSIQLHSTGDTKFMGGGPGLGLPIAKGVIEGHGGRIWVESEGYHEDACPGSRFHVLLPLRRGGADPDWVSRQLRKTRPLTGLAKRLVTRAGQNDTKGST